MNLIKHCKVCGAEYESCVSCEKTRNWRVHTDTAEHYRIFIALMNYQRDRDAGTAYQDLLNYGVDFSNTGNYISSVSALLRQIQVEAETEQETEQETEWDTEWDDSGDPD